MAEKSQRSLSDVLRGLAKTCRITCGAKEAGRVIKGARVMAYASKSRAKGTEMVVKAARDASLPVVIFPGTSTELGRALGRPYKVSVASIRVAGEKELSSLLESIGPFS